MKEKQIKKRRLILPKDIYKTTKAQNMEKARFRKTEKQGAGLLIHNMGEESHPRMYEYIR